MPAGSRSADPRGVGRLVRSPWLALILGLTVVIGVACDGDDDAPPPAGAQLAERWLRAGEDNNAAVQVYERALPPALVDLLNPDADADTPPEDLIALPVHPDGSLLGSYFLRRSDGSMILWLFYDVPERTMGEVIDVVAEQVNASPWQVLTQSGSRSNRLLAFENTRNEDVTGNAIAENLPGAAEFTVVVDRDGEEVTLTVAQLAPVPLLEATFNDALLVQDIFPGAARTAGLQEGDRIVRVGEMDVGSPGELQRTLEGMTAGPRTVSLLYVLQFAPPLSAEMPPFVPVGGLTLPANFPAADAWASFDLDQFEVTRDPSGQAYFAAFFTADTPSVAAEAVRTSLTDTGWEITGDEPAGFGTGLEFMHEGDGLVGFASIDEASVDDSLTQVFVQIQSATE